MRKSTHKKFVQEHLKLMFSSIRHGSQIEREVRTYVHTCTHTSLNGSVTVSLVVKTSNVKCIYFNHKVGMELNLAVLWLVLALPNSKYLYMVRNV